MCRRTDDDTKGKLLSPGHQPQQLSVLTITVPVLSATTATTAVDTEHKHHYEAQGGTGPQYFDI